jgi:hypothetical protein
MLTMPQTARDNWSGPETCTSISSDGSVEVWKCCMVWNIPPYIIVSPPSHDSIDGPDVENDPEDREDEKVPGGPHPLGVKVNHDAEAEESVEEEFPERVFALQRDLDAHDSSWVQNHTRLVKVNPPLPFVCSRDEVPAVFFHHDGREHNEHVNRELEGPDENVHDICSDGRGAEWEDHQFIIIDFLSFSFQLWLTSQLRVRWTQSMEPTGRMEKNTYS